MRAVLEVADRLEPDRFAGYSHAALSFERASLAVADQDPNAGPLLWEALSRLTTHGEHRTAEVCRRDLGRWRLEHGDAGGAADVARSARGLLARDSNAAAVAVAALAEIVPDHTGAGTLAAAAVALLDDSGGGPLSADERALVEAGRRSSDPEVAPMAVGELEALLLQIETGSAGTPAVLGGG